MAALAAAVHDCRGCDLWRNDTRAVFGEGRARSRLVMVGEQPGDMEEREGHPFVGPAGRLLARALDQAGIDRDTVYLTNAVKHFRFQQRGKRRIHQTPQATHVSACLPWLSAELATVRPVGVVTLGATAGKALLGRSFRVTESRGVVLEPPSADYEWLIATAHPS